MEMATNLANWSLATGEALKSHHLEQQADPMPATEVGDMTCSLVPQEYAPLPIPLLDAHVDDIINATQGNAQ